MSRPNDGVKLTATAAGRSFAEKMRPKKFKSGDEWIDEFNRLKLEHAEQLADMLKVAIKGIEQGLTTAKLIMECPTTNPALMLRASQLTVQASRELNQCVFNLWRATKDLDVKQDAPQPAMLPPDFNG